MLKDEIELRFVDLLKRGGVTHEQMERIILANEQCQHGPRLYSFVKIFAEEAKVTLSLHKLEAVPA